MHKNWIPLQSLPVGGKTFVLDDQAQWQEPFDEFGLNCRIIEPLRAEIFVLAQEQGVLFRGTIHGKVVLPCDRCADDSEVFIKHSFDSFEPYPAGSFMASGKDTSRASAGRKDPEHGNSEDDAELLDDADEAVIRSGAHGRGIEINPAALAWEEFSLTLPIKPLCRDDCKGLCPVCGSNKNTDACSCKKEQGDPRLAALRGLTIEKK
jgi:uncharacterized protein